MPCLTVILLLGALPALSADSTRHGKFTIATGGVVNVVNSSGSVILHQGSGRQVLVNATAHSDKVEADLNGTTDGRRIDFRSHPLAQQTPSNDESKVDYDITVPAGVSVIISTATAPITIENFSGDLSLSSDTGGVTIRNVNNAHLHVQDVAGPVVISDLTGGYVDITSTSGAVQLTNVSGPRVTVGTANGNITYRGDFTGGGAYVLTTHSGGIDVTVPETASVDLTARSVTGSVENELPLENKPHLTFVPSQGRSFAGTSNSGSSSVELESFSGKIRVMKQ